MATEVLKRFLGPLAVSLTAVAMMISSFGSLHASVLSNSRIPFAMARDGLFFSGLAKLSPRSNVPVRAMLAQAAWGSLLAVSGTYDTLTDSVIFASWLFYGLSAASLFVFRRTMPDAPRPYRALGYPVVPALFLLVTAALARQYVRRNPAPGAAGRGDAAHRPAVLLVLVASHRTLKFKGEGRRGSWRASTAGARPR